MVKHSPHVYGSPEVRYEAKIDRSGGPDACHPWTASLNRGGYGQMGVGGKKVEVHRWAFKTFIDPSIRDDQVVRHTCDNRPCQNPRHWVKGSHADNNRDCVERGRHAGASKTHCRRGHPFDELNTYWRADRPGCRQCRACNNEDSLRYYPKRGHRPRSSA